MLIARFEKLKIFKNLIYLMQIVFVIFLLVNIFSTQSRADSTTNLYIATSGTDSDDIGGANDCMVEENPCLTINHAMSQAGNDNIINIASGQYNEPLLFNSALDWNSNVSFIGSSTASTTINGGINFAMPNLSDIIFSHLTFIGGTSTDDIATSTVIQTTSDPLDSVSFDNCVFDGLGQVDQAFYLKNIEILLSLTNSLVQNYKGLYTLLIGEENSESNLESLTIASTTISNNKGVIYFHAFDTNFTDNTIINNASSSLDGGTIFFNGCCIEDPGNRVTVERNIMNGNSSGGLFLTNFGSAVISSNTLVNNGGDLQVSSTTYGIKLENIASSTIDNNSITMVSAGVGKTAVGIMIGDTNDGVLNIFDNSILGTGDIGISFNDYVTPSMLVSLGNTDISSSLAEYIRLQGTTADPIDATDISISGVKANLAVGMKLVEIEDKIYHGMDDESLGIVTFKSDNAVVTGNDGNDKIQRAINNYNDNGDEWIVTIGPGTYYNSASGDAIVEISNMPVTLIAASSSKPILACTEDFPGFGVWVQGNNITIDGLEVESCYGGIVGEGIVSSTIKNNFIHNNINAEEIDVCPNSNCGIGVYLYGANEDNLITDNIIYANDRQGILLGSFDSSQISVNNEISGNKIYNNGQNNIFCDLDEGEYGIELLNSDSNIIASNNIYGHNKSLSATDYFGAGIYLLESQNNTIENNNEIYDNRRNIVVRHRADYRLASGNKIKQNNLYQALLSDILIGAETGTVISKNKVQSNISNPVVNEGLEILNVSDNWWESDDGPKVNLGSQVRNYSWCLDEDCAATTSIKIFQSNNQTSSIISLSWEDMATGTQNYIYAIRYLKDTPITNSNWETAALLPGLLAKEGKSSNSVNNLQSKSNYYFGIKTQDQNGNSWGLRVASASTKEEQSSSGGGGISFSVYCTSVVFGEWKNCVNDYNYRDIEARVPAGCILRLEQERDRYKKCGKEEKKNGKITDIEINLRPEPQVLGVKIVNPNNSQTKSQEEVDKIINGDYWGGSWMKQQVVLKKQEATAWKKIVKINAASALSNPELAKVIAFIVYGTESTAGLTIADRSSLVYNFVLAYDKLPQASLDWQDLLKISTGRWPKTLSQKAETEASIQFRRFYQKRVDWNNNNDVNAIKILSYGIIPVKINIDAEKNAKATFRKIVGRPASSDKDWKIIRAIAYSGAKK